MKQFAYCAGGLLLVVGAVLPLFFPDVAPWVFAAGAVLFAPAQMADRYEGRNLIIRRLRRQQLAGDVAFLLSAAMMFMARYHIRPFTGGEWKVMLIIAVVFEVYTVFRIDAELKKDH